MNRDWSFRILIPLALLLPSCRQQMAEQPSYHPFEPAVASEDRMSSARPLVAGTVPRGHLREDPHFYQGEKGASNKWTQAAGIVAAAQFTPFGALTLGEAANPLADTFPVDQVVKRLRLEAVPEGKRMHAVLARGQEQFNVFCAICHDRTGGGKGMIVQRGYAQPPSYHIPRLRVAPLGHYYQVITHGYGAMPSHASQIPPEDRWAIVAYVRALQLSQNATLEDVQGILNKEGAEGREQERIPEDIRQAVQAGGAD